MKNDVSALFDPDNLELARKMKPADAWDFMSEKGWGDRESAGRLRLFYNVVYGRDPE